VLQSGRIVGSIVRCDQISQVIKSSVLGRNNGGVQRHSAVSGNITTENNDITPDNGTNQRARTGILTKVLEVLRTMAHYLPNVETSRCGSSFNG
jgi:hypothetical protein